MVQFADHGGFMRMATARAEAAGLACRPLAGTIADKAGVPNSTMSHHLASLERAGLVQSRRESRLIHYRADYAAMRRLLAFLMQDCCNGHPEMCADLVFNTGAQTCGDAI